jgi:hypothetical protein
MFCEVPKEIHAKKKCKIMTESRRILEVTFVSTALLHHINLQYIHVISQLKRDNFSLNGNKLKLSVATKDKNKDASEVAVDKPDDSWKAKKDALRKTPEEIEREQRTVVLFNLQGSVFFIYEQFVPVLTLGYRTVKTKVKT